MDSDVDEIVSGIPDLFEIVASSVEIGAILSELTGYLSIASFVAIVPALCKPNLAAIFS